MSCFGCRFGDLSSVFGSAWVTAESATTEGEVSLSTMVRDDYGDECLSLSFSISLEFC